MDDPYRSNTTSGTCPRCENTMDFDGELGRLVCTRGCGEWYPKTTLDQILAWHDVSGKPGGIAPDGTRAQATSWPWGPALCPVCRAEMAVGIRAELRFDYCGRHGVWLDAGEIGPFTQVFRLS